MKGDERFTQILHMFCKGLPSSSQGDPLSGSASEGAPLSRNRRRTASEGGQHPSWLDLPEQDGADGGVSLPVLHVGEERENVGVNGKHLDTPSYYSNSCFKEELQRFYTSLFPGVWLKMRSLKMKEGVSSADLCSLLLDSVALHCGKCRSASLLSLFIKCPLQQCYKWALHLRPPPLSREAL